MKLPLGYGPVDGFCYGWAIWDADKHNVGQVVSEDAARALVAAANAAPGLTAALSAVLERLGGSKMALTTTMKDARKVLALAREGLPCDPSSTSPPP